LCTEPSLKVKNDFAGNPLAFDGLNHVARGELASLSGT
jgi:hypothetical protein